MDDDFIFVEYNSTVMDEGVFGCFLYCSQVVVGRGSRDGLVLHKKESVKFVCPHAPKGLRMPVIRVSAIEIHAEDMYA